MSGTSGAADIVGGSTSESAQASDLMSVETAGTHVGTPAAPFGFWWNGAMLSFQTGISFIATPDLYAALNAASIAVSLITWSN